MQPLGLPNRPATSADANCDGPAQGIRRDDQTDTFLHDPPKRWKYSADGLNSVP